MTDQWHGQSGPGERWNVNLPAVVGVVFVFLVGVVIWVIAGSGGDDELAIDGASNDSSSTSAPFTPLIPTTTLPIVTSPVPLPVLTTAVATVPPAVPATNAPAPAPPAPAPPAPVATQPPAPPATPPAPTVAPTPAPTAPPPTAEGGDLGIPGHPIERPACDGSAITILASAIGAEATVESMQAVLDDFAGSHYLRTDQTCSSLTQAQNGQPIYVVYFGPFADVSDACEARDDGPSDAYIRRLSTELPPGHSVPCS